MKKEITLKKFNEKYNQPAKNWQFDKFRIVCVKCGSDKVEYNGKMEVENGYYGAVEVFHLLVVKCHDCGNAFAMKDSDGGGGFCNHD